MTPDLLTATLGRYVEGVEKSRRLAFAVLSRDKWAGPEELTVGDRPVRVRWCCSMLEMRDRLCAWDHAEPLAIVTSVEDHVLAADLRARIFGRKVHEVNVWTVLESLLSVRTIDGRVRGDRVLGNALLETVARSSVTPPISGVLYEESVWDILLPAHFGIASARADLKELLDWMRSAKGAETWPPELVQKMVDWFARKLGPPAKAVFDCWLGGADPLPIGLSFEPMLAGDAAAASRAELDRALGRMERFTNHETVPHAAAIEWHEAAQRAIAGLEASQIADVADRLDRTLIAVGIEQYGYLSRWSRTGALQSLDRFAGRPSESALARLNKRHWSAEDKGILERGEMVLRLGRWLEMPDIEWSGFQASLDWYRSEGSWVDWARSRLRFTSESGKWNAAVATLLENVRLRRESQNRRFAAILVEWTRDGSPRPALGVESILDAYVVPLAERHSVLLVVMDGMSLAIARALEPELTSRRWNFWSDTEAELPPAVAALPSVTQFSRASLLAGKLVSGAQDVETRLFTARPGLRRPALFHKNDLAPASDEVLREIADPDRRVVAVVINAIDDELSGSRQISPEWTLEYLAVLRGILAEAATAGRVVVLTSDHGHMLDTGAVLSRADSAVADRWRPSESKNGAPAGDDELLVSGSRVLSPGGNFAGLAVESARYQRPKVGYHGGLTPQECLAPVVVLAQPSISIRGWYRVTSLPPLWWLQEGAPRPVRQGEAFSPAPSLPDAHWIDELVGSEVFLSQIANTNGKVSADHVEAAVRALGGAGGRLLKGAFAARVGITPGRVSAWVAAVQRVLNVDSYGILELDESSQTVTLNRQLLVKQFRLG